MSPASANEHTSLKLLLNCRSFETRTTFALLALRWALGVFNALVSRSWQAKTPAKGKWVYVTWTTEITKLHTHLFKVFVYKLWKDSNRNSNFSAREYQINGFLFYTWLSCVLRAASEDPPGEKWTFEEVDKAAAIFTCHSQPGSHPRFRKLTAWFSPSSRIRPRRTREYYHLLEDLIHFFI